MLLELLLLESWHAQNSTYYYCHYPVYINNLLKIRIIKVVFSRFGYTFMTFLSISTHLSGCSTHASLFLPQSSARHLLALI